MKKTTLNSIRWMVWTFSTFVMAFAPVADGFAAQKAAQELNEARVKELLISMGMTKQQTLGSFWTKNKAQFPPRIQKIVGDLFVKHGKEKMPGLDVASAKGADGKNVPVVRLQLPGHLLNIEVHDTDRYFAKIGNTELNNIDINNFTVMFEKMYHNDYQFRRWVDSQAKTSGAYQILGKPDAIVKNEFSLPEINAEMWKKMTPEARVRYVLNMREMWSAAMAVLANKPGQKANSKSKKTSSIDVLEEIWKLMNPDAKALQLTSGEGARATGAVPGTTGKVFDDACLIAGYAVNYKGKTTTCDAADVKKRYSDPIYQKAHSACNSNQIACNPMIYGTPEGRPVCVTVALSDKDFQVATHYKGPCERGHQGNGSEQDNRLSSEIKFLKEDLKNKNRYGKDNTLLDEKQLKEEVRKEQEASKYSQTKYFLDGLMKSQYPELVGMFTKGTIDQKVIDALLKIKEGFDTQIVEARKACKTSTEKRDKQESNFWGACDQLQRREIFVGEYLATNVGCADKDQGAVFDIDTLKCKCPDKIAMNKIVFPGQSCGAPGRTDPGAGAVECGPNGRSANGQCVPAPDQACKNVGFETGKLSEEKPDKVICSCKGGAVSAPLDEITSNKFSKAKCLASPPSGRTPPRAEPAADDGGSCSESKKTQCEDEVSGKKGKWTVRTAPDGAQACSCARGTAEDEEDGWWKRNKENVYMAAIAGVVVLALIKSAPKRPSIAPPGDTCTSGQSSCPGVCPKANQVKVNGVCQCREPSPLEKLLDAVECTYGPNDGAAATITCPDGVTKTESVSACPKQTCSDGSTVYVGQSCPTEIPTTKPTSTTGDVKK